PQAALVADFAFVEIPGRRLQWNHDSLRRNNDFEVPKNMFLECSKARSGIGMIVGGQRSRIGIKAECAKRSSQPRHFAEQVLWMPMLRQQNVPQGREARIDRVQKPELRNLA